MRSETIEILFNCFYVCVTYVSNVACPMSQGNSVSIPNNAHTCTRVTEPKVLHVNENKYLRGYVFHYLEGASLIDCGLRYILLTLFLFIYLSRFIPRWYTHGNSCMQNHLSRWWVHSCHFFLVVILICLFYARCDRSTSTDLHELFYLILFPCQMFETEEVSRHQL